VTVLRQLMKRQNRYINCKQLQNSQHLPVQEEQSLAEARETQQILSKAEEQALTRCITQFTRSGRPVRHPKVREMAEALRM
jgi:hypothetical protein